MIGGGQKSKKTNVAQRFAKNAKELRDAKKTKKTGLKVRIRKAKIQNNQASLTSQEHSKAQLSAKDRQEYSGRSRAESKKPEMPVKPENSWEMYEKVEQEKRLIMWSGITFFMVLITFFWVYNFNNVFLVEADKQIAGKSWEELSDEFGQQLEQMKIDIEKIQAFEDQSGLSQAGILPDNDKLETGTSSKNEIIFSDEDIEILKEKLENTNKPVINN